MTRLQELEAAPFRVCGRGRSQRYGRFGLRRLMTVGSVAAITLVLIASRRQTQQTQNILLDGAHLLALPPEWAGGAALLLGLADPEVLGLLEFEVVLRLGGNGRSGRYGGTGEWMGAEPLSRSTAAQLLQRRGAGWRFGRSRRRRGDGEPRMTAGHGQRRGGRLQTRPAVGSAEGARL